MGGIEYGRELQFFTEDFNKAVYAFFDLPSSQQMEKSQGMEEIMSRQQYMNVRVMCRYLERVSETAYATCFGIDREAVEFRIAPQNRLEISSATDIKALCDANVFPEEGRAKLQKLYHMEN